MSCQRQQAGAQHGKYDQRGELEVFWHVSPHQLNVGEEEFMMKYLIHQTDNFHLT